MKQHRFIHQKVVRKFKRLKETLKWKDQKRIWRIQRIENMMTYFSPTHPAHIILHAEARGLRWKSPVLGFRDEENPAKALAAARLELSTYQRLCPVRDMKHWNLLEIERHLGFVAAPSNLSQTHENILYRPYGVFIDLIHSGKDLVTELPDFPIKKDVREDRDAYAEGDDLRINLVHHLPLSNAIFLAHFDIDVFCEQVTWEKFNARMNLEEFTAFDRRHWNDQPHVSNGVLVDHSATLSYRLHVLQGILKETEKMLAILMKRYACVEGGGGSYYPRFYFDRPTVAFFCK